MFTSNYTSDADLRTAVEHGAILNLDDASLCASIPNGCPELVSFRLNPGIGSTSSETQSNVLGGPSAKFGVPRAHIVEAYREAHAHGATRFGMHMMTGSCVLEASYWEKIVEELMDAVAEVSHELSVDFDFINIGGGLGIPYSPEEEPIELGAVVGHVRSAVDRKLTEHSFSSEPTLYMECGRYMTGPFGWLVSRCNAVKDTRGAYGRSMNIADRYYGLDANMSHLMRPGMYGAYHHITVPGREGGNVEPVNVVGTLCENNDWFAAARPMPASAKKGDLFVIHDTGAHSHSMGFQYNCTPRAPELLQRLDGSIDLIRRRETAEDLFANTREH
jgi:diaminopimelate decarboxylase